MEGKRQQNSFPPYVQDCNDFCISHGIQLIWCSYGIFRVAGTGHLETDTRGMKNQAA